MPSKPHPPKSKSDDKPSSKKENVPRSWSMYPEFHKNVVKLLEENDLSFTFFSLDNDDRAIREYDTNIKGRFVCSNRKCPQKGWASNIIAITIRMYPKQKYNARVYHQRCQSCQALSRPFPDKSYAQRIAYRLKKWSGIEMDPPFYAGSENKRPHASDLCEGCKHGHCKAV